VGIFCRGETAAEHLPPVRCTAPTRRHPDINTPFLQERLHSRDQVDMLDGGDKTGGFPKKRDGFSQHCDIETNFPWQEDDPLLFIDRCVTNMNEDIGMVKGPERKVTGTITGIPADDNVEPLVPECGGIPGSPPFQAGRELECNGLCPAFPQLSDKFRGIA
jgi:hypothetical protein